MFAVLRCAIASALLVPAGCTAPEVRRATYPPGFQYLTREEIRGTMAELAVRIEEIDRLLATGQQPRPADRERIAELLAQMDAFAGDLVRGSRSNHPRIDRAGPRLQEDIRRARIDASADPPSYYEAGRLVGACTYCHAPPLRRTRPPLAAPEILR